MAIQYISVPNDDLTFDDIITPFKEDQPTVPENLIPTVAMQDRFMRNCTELQSPKRHING